MNTINPNQLPQVRWQNQNVITTELLAQCYSAEERQIRQNYANNKSRFIEGKHFFKLEGEDLQSLRVDKIDSQISSKARSLILWTEKGAARHSKILDTEKAWDMFDQLEEAYFHPERREAQPTFKLSFTPEELEDLVNRRVAESSVSLQNKYITLLEQENSRLKAPEPTVFGLPRKWSAADDQTLLALKAQGLGYTRIGFKMGRSGNSIKHRYVRLMAQGCAA